MTLDKSFSYSQGKLTTQYRNLKNPDHTAPLYNVINYLIKNSALTKTSPVFSTTELRHIFKLVNFAWKQSMQIYTSHKKHNVINSCVYSCHVWIFSALLLIRDHTCLVQTFAFFLMDF